jgi:hypothetical protein
MADPEGKEFCVLRRARRGRPTEGPVTSPLPGAQLCQAVDVSLLGCRRTRVGFCHLRVGPVSSLPQVAGESQAGHTCHPTNRLWQRGRA